MCIRDRLSSPNSLRRRGGGVNDCAKCGTQNQEGANFCCRCGSRLLQRDLSETTVTYAPASSDAAAVLSQTDRTLGRVPTLLIRAGGGREGEQILLDNDLLTLGRNPESHLFLDDVSYTHLTLPTILRV